MAYTMYLDNMQLPVMPSKIQLKIQNRNKTLETINYGEINILKAAGLTEISFDALLPQTRYPFASYPGGFKEAAYYLEKLEKLKTGKKPFRFIVSRVSPAGALLFDTNIMAALEEYTISEDVKEGLDLLVSIKLKQYREYGTKTVKLKTTSKGTTATVQSKTSSTKKTPAKTYTVKKGDTLWNICKKYLGDGSKCWEIAKLNNISNPAKLRMGQVIRLG